MENRYFWNRTVVDPKIKIFTFAIFFIAVFGVWLFSFQELRGFPIISTIRTPMDDNLKNQKIAMIIAFRDFQDDEYFISKEILEKAEAEITTVSTEQGTAIGVQGGEVEVSLVLGSLRVSDFDAIVFIGGPGALRYLDNESSYDIVKKTVSENKVLAAICISPVVLANAGVLSGKKATVWSSPLDKEAIRILEKKGAVYQEAPAVIDGKIITADGPASAAQFADAIIDVLTRVIR